MAINRATNRNPRREFLSLGMVILIIIIGSCRSQTPEVHTATPFNGPFYGIDFLEKGSPDQIRIMSFNAGWDAIFPDDDPLDLWRQAYKADEFIRIVRAIEPDILCLQEINPNRDPQQVGDILDAVLPLEGNQTWRTHSGQDNLIAARFDLSLKTDQLIHKDTFTNLGHAMALVDLPDDLYENDLYLICAHFKSQGGQANIQVRQEHADAIAAWIGDAKLPGGEIELPFGIGIVVLGDFNVYDTDPAHHLTTLISGDIEDEDRYGNDIKPDWDETGLADAVPRHNGGGEEVYTWRDDTQKHNPGILDHMLYTDSVILLENAFVLNTTIMAEDELEAAGLELGDVTLELETGWYDHLPLAIDISFQELPAEQ